MIKRLIELNYGLLEFINVRACYLPGGDKIACKWRACHECEGSGVTLTEALRGVAFTEKDIEADPGFFEDYAEGKFDVPCRLCKGHRVVPFPNVEIFTDERQAEILKEFMELDEARRESEAEAYYEGKWQC